MELEVDVNKSVGISMAMATTSTQTGYSTMCSKCCVSTVWAVWPSCTARGHATRPNIAGLVCCCFVVRYEPCGLVDIEFGWYGGLIVGNATGGLGKMPGFYFSAGELKTHPFTRELMLQNDALMTSG
jgi:hypothetical protein